MATTIEKVIVDDNEFYQAYIVFDGSNATTTNFIDANTLHNADGTTQRLTFISAKWSVAGAGTFSLSFHGSTTVGPIITASGNGEITLEMYNDATGTVNGDIQLITANAPTGFLVVTFRKDSGFYDIDSRSRSYWKKSQGGRTPHKFSKSKPPRLP